ncbi:MAG: response regulator, partial [Myxococcales bacterium]|nr:response regulator [Myxococcales bacterium]
EQRAPALWRRVSAAPRGRYTGEGIWAWTHTKPTEGDASALSNATPWVVLVHVEDADVRRYYAVVLIPTGLIALALLGLFGALARRLSARERSLREARDHAEAATQAAALVSAITGAANAAMTTQEMVYLSLRPLCRATGIGVAVAMFGDEVGMHYIHATADAGAVGDALRALDDSAWLRGIPRAKHPLWLEFSDTSSAHAGAEWCIRASAAGLAGALGIPILVDGEALASCVLLYDTSYRHRKEAFATIVKAGSEALAAEIGNVLLRERANLELTQARRLAEESNSAKTEFLAHISHELRTPLNGVIGAARLMRGEFSRVEQRKFLRIIEESGSHLLALINEILDVGKIESGELTFVEEDVDVVAIVDQSLQSLKSLADSKGVRLVHLADPAMTRMYRADATRVTQIVTNLVGNALKFTDIGKIVVRTREHPNSTRRAARLEFAIEDSGRGISHESLERIFERYVQAKPEDRRRPEGVGLGLHISRLLIDRMGGSIAAESPNPNNAYDTPGARFVFNIVVPRSSHPSPYAPISGGHLRRVWVVDEDAELGEHIARLIESWGTQAAHYTRFPERPADPPDIVLRNAALDAPAWVACASAYTEPVARSDIYRHLAPIAVEEDDEHPENTPIRRILAENAARRRRVLLVEDNPVNQLILGKFLELMDFTFEARENGREAVDYFNDPARTTLPDCVLMDSNMPIMSGPEATQRLRALGVTVPIIAVTADAMADEVQRCLDAGMDDFISKPVDLNHLAVVLLRKLFADKRP